MKAAIFDLDGTLLDTILDITRAVNAGLAAFGFPERSAEECRGFVGEGLELLVQRAMQSAVSSEAPNALPEGPAVSDLLPQVLEAVRQDYLLHPVDNTMLYPGIDLLLDRLSERGIPMAILTNKPDELARLCAEKLLSRWTFVGVIGSTPDFVPKPDKKTAIELARIMDARPPETAMIGDSEIDILTARNAGMYAAAVSWGLRSRQVLEALEPDLIVDRPEKVLQLFG